MPVSLGQALLYLGADDDLSPALDRTERATNRWSTKLEQLTGDTADDIGKSFASIRGDLDKLQKGFDGAVPSHLQAAIQGVRAALGALDTGLVSGAQGAKILQTALEHLDAESAKVGAQLEDTGKKASGFGGFVKEAFSFAAGGFIQQGVSQIASAVGNMFVTSIKTAGDFEKSLLRLDSVAGSSMTEAGLSVDDFRKKFLQLGADTQFSASEAADAAIALAKGGRPVAEIMREGAQETLNLAAAGELGLGASAEIVSKQLGVWADRGVKAADVSNLLAQAANASTVDVDELALGLANTGEQAKLNGLKYQELVTSMALLAPGFSSASDAGTSFKTFLMSLTPTAETQIEAMIDLGLATQDGGSKFYDAQGAFIGMEAASKLLNDATKDLSEEQKNLAFKTIFGADASRAAAIIAEQGADGYKAMAAGMNAAGTAAEQAAKRNQGLNFALDTLKGSWETLLVVLGTMALPLITKLINKALIPAVNGVTGFAQSLADGTAAASPFFNFLADVALPTFTGLVAAVIAYGIQANGLMIPALIKSIPLWAAQAVAAAKSAVAIAAAAAPYVAIALAVAAVTVAVQKFNNQTEEATNKLLNSRQWWVESTKALEDYDKASEQVRSQIGDKADGLRKLREEQQGEIDFLLKFGSTLPKAKFDAHMKAINERAEAIKKSTTELNKSAEATQHYEDLEERRLTNTNQMTEATRQLKDETALSAEEMKILCDELGQVMDQGAQAIGSMVENEMSFTADREERVSSHEEKLTELYKEQGAARGKAAKDAVQKKIDEEIAGFQEEEQEAALSYARQQAQQLQHLGEMLINYVNNQVAMGNMDKDRAIELTGKIAAEYGVREDLSAMTFAEMTKHIDQFATNSNISADKVIGDLGRISSDAVTTKTKMEELEGQYVAELETQLKAGSITPEEFARRLAKIPAQVQSEVVIKYTEVNAAPRPQQRVGGAIDESNENPQRPQRPLRKLPGRAKGGPVSKGRLYIVGERGPELFEAPDSGNIINNRDTMSELDRIREAAQQRGKPLDEDSADAFLAVSNRNMSGVEADLLQQLVTNGLVVKGKRGFKLSRLGQTIMRAARTPKNAKPKRGQRPGMDMGLGGPFTPTPYNGGRGGTGGDEPAFQPTPYRGDEGTMSNGGLSRDGAPAQKPGITINLGGISVTLEVTGGSIPLADKAAYEDGLSKLLKDGKVVEAGIAKALGPAIDKLILGGIGD